MQLYTGQGVCPPLGRQDSIISINSMQNCGMPPPFVSWEEALSPQMVGEELWFRPTPNFGLKTELNLSEDLFFLFMVFT